MAKAKAETTATGTVRIGGGGKAKEFTAGARLEITAGGSVWSVWPMADGSLRVCEDGNTPLCIRTADHHRLFLSKSKTA